MTIRGTIVHLTRNGFGRLTDGFAALWQIRIQEAEHVRALNGANAFGFLQVGNALMERFHFDPMHFRPEMVFGVVAVVEEEPVVDFSVTAHAPGDRFVGVSAVMTVVAVQITEAVAEIPERHKIKNHVSPVEEKHREERDCEGGQLKVSPDNVVVAALAKFFADRADIISEETFENIAPRTFDFAVVPMTIDRQPIDRVARFILSI